MSYSYRDLKTLHTKPFIQKITVKHIYDQNPDLSHLQQDYFNDNPKYPLCSQKLNEKYKKQDAKRLEAYNNNEWYCFGIRADTDILVPQNNYEPYSYRVIPITSGGVWGYESDDPQGFKEQEDDQINDLKELLKVFNVEVDPNVEIIRLEDLQY